MANQKIPETLAANLAGSLDFTELALIAKGGLVKGIALSAIRAGLLAATATAADASKLGGLSPSSYQLSLVSGTNLKTVGGVSLLGSGDVTVGDMLLGTAQEVTAAKTFDVSTLVLKGSTSGTSTLNAAAVAGTTTFTLPGSSGTLALLSDIPSLSGYETTSHASSTYQTLAGMSGYLTTSGTAADSSKLGGTAAASYALASDLSSYLTTATAASTYQTQAGMSSYLTTASAASTYLALSGGTLTGSLTLGGNISAAAWTTAGIKLKGGGSTLTDTTSSGTVALAVTNKLGGNTIAASNATTFTDYATLYLDVPAAGTNVTITNPWSLIASGAMKSTALTLTGGTLTLNGATSGASVLSAPAVAGSATITLPGVTSTLATLGANTFTALQTITVGAANTGVLASTGYSLTGSDTTSMVNLTGTLNTSGSPSVFKLSITNTGSGSSTRLLDIYWNGSRCLDYWPSQGLLTNYLGGFLSHYNVYSSSYDQLGISISSVGKIGFSSTTLYGNNDLILLRDAAGILAQRNGVNAQTLRVYNTYTDASNYERGVFDWTTTANTLTIGVQKAGTGSDRALMLNCGASQQIYFGVGGTVRWMVNATGSGNDFGPNSDKSVDIGNTGGRVRSLYLGQSLTGSSTTGAIDISSTWNTSGTPTLILANVTDTASNASSLLLDLQVGGSSKFKVRKDGLLIIGDITNGGAYGFPAAGAFQAFGTDSQCSFQSTIFGVSVRSGGYFAWASSSSSASASTDTALFRDAAGVIAQRNGVNAQTLRVYNTYTDASNNEYLSLDWSSNIATIEPKANGTGTARTLRIRGGGYNVIEVSPSGDAILCSGGGQVSFGGSTSSYPAFRRSGTLLQVRLGDNSADGPVSCSYVKTGSTTVAGLPSASTAGSGARAFVTDANATTFLSTVAGGGANKVPVVSDGTNWIIG